MYYEQQQAGLGERFLAAVETGFRQIAQNPTLARRVRGNIRRCLVEVFPYGMIYARRENDIFVLAVIHLKREPDYWLGRTDPSSLPEG